MWEPCSLFLGSYGRSSDILSQSSRKSRGTVRCSTRPTTCRRTAGPSLHEGVLNYKLKQVCPSVWRARLVRLYEVAVACVFLMMDVDLYLVLIILLVFIQSHSPPLARSGCYHYCTYTHTCTLITQFLLIVCWTGVLVTMSTSWPMGSSSTMSQLVTAPSLSCFSFMASPR